MRIIINAVTGKKISGGGFQIAQNFIKTAIADDYHQDEFFFFVSQDLADALKLSESPRVCVVPTQPDYLHTYLPTGKRLKERIKMIQPDLMYSVLAPCYYRFPVKEVMRITNPWVVHPNDYARKTLSFNGKLRNDLYCLLQKYYIKRCYYFVTQAEYTGESLAKLARVPERNVRVVKNVLPAVYRDMDNTSIPDEQWINITSVTAAFPHKNLDIIPAVLKDLRDNHAISNVRFHVTLPENDTILLHIKEELRKCSLEDRVISHGRMTQVELAGLYRHSQMMFLPTLLEVFSASILEAMCFDLKIVASDFPFNSDVIGDSGLLFKPTDHKDAAEKIARIINDTNLQKDLSMKMKKQLEVYGYYKSHYDKTIEFLEEVGRGEI